MAERLNAAPEKNRSRLAEFYANVNTSIGLAALAAGYALSSGMLAAYGVWNVAQGEGARFVSRRHLERKNSGQEKTSLFKRVGNIFRYEPKQYTSQFAFQAEPEQFVLAA